MKHKVQESFRKIMNSEEREDDLFGYNQKDIPFLVNIKWEK